MRTARERGFPDSVVEGIDRYRTMPCVTQAFGPCERYSSAAFFADEPLMIQMILLQSIVVAGAVAVGVAMPMWPAIGVWAVAALLLCILGAALIASQPLNTPTFAGLIGSVMTRRGFRVGDGRLPPAVLVSWLYWIALGSAAIAIVHHRADVWLTLLVLSWLVLTLGLMFIAGQIIVASKAGRVPGSLGKLAGFLTLLLLASGGLAAVGHTGIALTLAGIPIALIGGGYGLFVLLIVTVGRNARWN